MSKAELITSGDNDVVSKWYAEYLTRCYKLLSYGDVLPAWFGYTRRVIVSNYYSSRTVFEGPSEHFTRVHERRG